MIKDSESVFNSNINISHNDMERIENSDNILSVEKFIEKFPCNPVVLMGQLEDVCVRQTAESFLLEGRIVLVSQDLVVDRNNENHIGGVTNNIDASWDYLAKNTGSSLTYRGNLIFLIKK
ncbi:cysteine hydrolase family protein [Pseudomonas khavaziana]|uniref:hypothetical protein n=1 Tax=Pseudomonas khavaziana TaxID=2842351 RepID=UPI001C3C6A8C|nr:hypothetical protein [Pseudomonas khavaziana]MBV4483825.1 hypothetical protein [Pseudomonas khavaziana]